MFTNVKTAALLKQNYKTVILIITVTIMKKKKIENSGGNIFKNGVNIPGVNFPGGIHQGRIWLVETFRVGVFLIPKKIYAKNSQAYMHWHSSEKSSFSKPITSMCIPAPIIIFFLWCWNIFSYFSTTDWWCKCPYWVHGDVNFSSHM